MIIIKSRCRTHEYCDLHQCRVFLEMNQTNPLVSGGSRDWRLPYRKNRRLCLRRWKSWRRTRCRVMGWLQREEMRPPSFTSIVRRLLVSFKNMQARSLLRVLYDRNTGKSRGFAFVTMSTIEECNKVIQMPDGSEYNGRTLRVNFSDKPKPKEPLYPETEHKLFVGNLSWSVTFEIDAGISRIWKGGRS